MNIRKIKGEQEFRELTGYSEELNIFFSSNYANYKLATKNKYKQYFFLLSDNYVIPVLIHKYYVFVYCDFVSEPVKYNLVAEENEKSFLNEVCLYLKKKENVQWILPTPPYTFFSAYPTNAKVIPFGSQVIDLTKNEEELFSSMDPKHRTMTRRGEKADVSIKFGRQDLIDEFCRIEEAMWKRSDINADNKSNLSKLVNNLETNLEIGIAYKNETAQVGLVVFYNKASAYCMYAGRGDNMEPGANNLLYWKMILRMKNYGVKKFCIVGYRIDEDTNSKVHNIQRFKDRFGGNLKQGYMFKIEFNPNYHKLFNFLLDFFCIIKGKKQTNNKDIIDQEIHKWQKLNY